MVKRRRWKSKLQVRGVIMKKVVKFGGSSLANAEQFQKVGDIIRSDESRRYVVPSAPGKRFDEDIKVTDMLYGCYDAASKGEDITEKINAIKARYYEIIKGLGLSLSLEEEFKKIDEDFRAQAGIQYAASRGEFLNGKIMAAYLGYDFVDAASVIRFDKAGNLEAEETNKLLSKKLSKSQHAVTARNNLSVTEPGQAFYIIYTVQQTAIITETVTAQTKYHKTVIYQQMHRK